MSNPNPERDESKKQGPERFWLIPSRWGFLPQQTKPTKSDGIEYVRADLLNGQVIGTLESTVEPDAATRMRDRCVEKVKSMRDEWVKKLAETDDLLWNAWIDAANRIINQLESLTLEQGEQNTNV